MRSGRRLLLSMCVFIASSPVALMRFAKAQSTDVQTVVKFDSSLDDLISPDAKLQLLGSDFGITEGPNWVAKGKTGYLVFTDIAANVIYKMTPNGEFTVLVDHAGYTKFDPWNVAVESTNGRDQNDPLFRKFFYDGANGLSIDKEGRIIVATFIGRSIVRIEKNGKRTLLADQYQGKHLGGPNDVVVKTDGSIYFSDTRAGVRGRGHDPKEDLPPQGIYMIRNGKVSLVVDDIPTPNGLAFSPDEKYLYANGSGRNYIRRYLVQPDGTVSHSELLIDLSADKTPGVTDGMKVDVQGNIYSSGPGGIWIISPEGKHLGTILVHGQNVTNLCFGDPDYKALYITDNASLFKIRVKTPGHRVF